ncbi:phage tail sheath subtilisin-like domain-containing protein [Crassaminicella profunda]|uniref:phage tail sheath subtilisin-like domain-containing protein n=1 Tax=Crassaminicella profunda TaxID=1286698 RepID=UPI001CA735A8|nr:phage tail sheath subtilisin-like domain-containing protein [Crassaminicella profunda]QZY56709.1 phage tail sheath subtilisin-like domain-containing protein [Crassaminicella profunda]
MAIKDTQRVGVFSESQVSKEVMGFPGTCWPVGIVAAVDQKVYKETTPKAYAIQVKEDAYTLFGKNSEMAKLVEIQTLSGVNKLICVPVLKPSTGDITKTQYKTALNVLYNEEAVKIVICDSPDADVHTEVRNHCDKASLNRKERRSHVGATADSISAWTVLATSLNSGRLSIWGSIPLKTDGSKYENSVYLAAACAAQDALELDPAMPLHNLELPRELFGGLYNRFDDADLEALYAGGIAACRSVNGKIFIDRWVTTYTKDDTVNPAVADDKYQEGTVAKIKDFIDEGLRNRLATLHPRVKASLSAMNEVKADAVNWLKIQEEKEIIEKANVYKIERQADKKSRFHVYYNYGAILPLNTIFLHGKALV